MKRNLYDDALNGVSDIVELVSDSVAKEFKGVKPFDKEPVSEDQQLAEYMAMNSQMMDERLQRDGIEATNAYIQQMEELKEAKGYA